MPKSRSRRNKSKIPEFSVPIISPINLPINRSSWSSWPGIALRFKCTSTDDFRNALDFLPVFSEFGNITGIKIASSEFSFHRPNRDMRRKEQSENIACFIRGEITFVPPPDFPFWCRWDRNNHDFTFQKILVPYLSFGDINLGSGTATNRFMFEVFPACKITFGQMVEEDIFVSEYQNRNNKHDVFVHFNFKYRKIHIEFSHSFDPAGPEHEEEIVRFRLEHEMRHVNFFIKNGRSQMPVLWISSRMPPMIWRKTRNPVRIEDANNYRDHYYWRRTTLIQPSWTMDDDDKKTPFGVLINQNDRSVVNTSRWRVCRIMFNINQFRGQNARRVFNEVIEFFGNFAEKMVSPIRGVVESRQIPELNFSKLSFEQRYMIECLISKDLLNEYNVEQKFIDAIASMDESTALKLLLMMHDCGRTIWRPTDYIARIKRNRENMGVSTFSSKTITPYCVLTRRVVVTPTRIILEPPSIETTNRITRFYKNDIDRFLRVTFADEADSLRGKNDNTFDRLFNRVHNVLQNGLIIGGRQYEFLAASSSQLKEHGCWYYNSDNDSTAKLIRSWMGDFSHIRVPARYVSRLGQAFSSTRDITKVNNVVTIEDKKSADGKYCFSDGVGRIGKNILVHCHQTIDDDMEKPIALQFRMGGCKGVLVYWPDVDDNTVHVRPSQIKFISSHDRLEVIRGSSFKTAFLNRQVVTVLNTALGIADEVLLEIQEEEEKKVRSIDHDQRAALRFLNEDMDGSSPATTMLRQAVECGFLDRRDIVVTNMMRLLKAWRLRDIKAKARIPVYDGAFLLGVMDESAVLKENEIFVKIQRNGQKSQVIDRLCIICRSPCIHPGDIQIVRAVAGSKYEAKLGHLRNVVVFPSKGSRDLASQCGGGDLDGDEYMVIWDPRLMPKQTAHMPMNYKAIVDGTEVSEVTVTDIAEFIIEFFKGNNLGAIANNWLANADLSPLGSLDPKCMKLAELHAMAVDFAKTGRRAILPQDLYAKSYPDFMENDKKKQHKSEKALGQMYRNIVLMPFKPDNGSEIMDDRICLASEDNIDTDELLRGNLWDVEVMRWVPLAEELKEEYDQEVIRLQRKYDISTEYEIFTGVVIRAERKKKKRACFGMNSTFVEKRDWDIREELSKVFGRIRMGIREKILNHVLGDEALFGAKPQVQDDNDWAADVNDEFDSDPSIPVLPKQRGVAKLTFREMNLLSPFVIAMYRITIRPQFIQTDAESRDKDKWWEGDDQSDDRNEDEEPDQDEEDSEYSENENYDEDTTDEDEEDDQDKEDEDDQDTQEQSILQRFTFPWIFHDVLKHIIMDKVPMRPKMITSNCSLRTKRSQRDFKVVDDYLSIVDYGSDEMEEEEEQKF